MIDRQKRIIFLGMLFFFICPIASVFGSHIATIKVPPKETPEKCYQIIRDGKSLKGEHNMPVFIGDEIRLFKGKKVSLIYVRPDWGKLEVTRYTIVACPEKMTETAKGRISEVKIATTKHDEKDTSCFPSRQFNVSPIPPNSTMVLADEPILFRWSESGVSCADALLIIEDDKKSSGLNLLKNCRDGSPTRLYGGMSTDLTHHQNEKQQKIDIRLGELRSVDASFFKSGKAYTWFIEQDGKLLSETYSFRVLSKAEAEPIRNQLSAIEKLHPEQSPQLLQALFLQSISEPLYADSLRILYQLSEKSAIPDDVFNVIYERCW